MFKISNITNANTNNVYSKNILSDNRSDKNISNTCATLPKLSSENYKAYIPAFCAVKNAENSKLPSRKVQLKTVNQKLDKTMQQVLQKLDKSGVLDDNKSNDGSTVLENLYKIASEPRMTGLDEGLIISEVVKAIDNPYSITQKFGDIPENAEQEIKNETGEQIPENAKNVVSSSCVVASIEFNLASKMPAEFARFAQGLSSENYSVTKNIKLSNIAEGTASGLWMLRSFNTENKINSWDNISINVKPDDNAILRARVQTSYKDPDERSCVDVLIQSALLNLGSQHTYNSLTDERTGKFNPDNTGLTDFEKTFVEDVVLEHPKISVVYQALDENGVLVGYNCKKEETKQHILNSLDKGQNVIVGYTHLDSNNKVDGGHEITITGYEEDKNGEGWFVCNDTDDNISEPIKVSEQKLLPLIHHAGISKESLNSEDIIVEPWREILDEFKQMLQVEKQAG